MENKQSLFSLKCNNNNNLILSTPSKYKFDESVICSESEFKYRICELFSYFKDFDWTNVMFAGGLLSAMMEQKYDPLNFAKSDIDLFITDSKDYERVYNYFKSKFNKVYSFGYIYSNVINIITPEFNRSIQLIGLFDSKNKKTFESFEAVLKGFDLSHCQVGFTGNNIIYTDEFMNTMKNRISTISGDKVHAYRIVKAVQRGYSIAAPTQNIFVKNYFSNYTDIKVPGLNHADKFRDIKNLDLGELIGNTIVQKNLNKYYIPKKSESDEQVFKKISDVFPNPIIIKNNNLNFAKEKDIYLNKRGMTCFHK